MSAQPNNAGPLDRKDLIQWKTDAWKDPGMVNWYWAGWFKARPPTC